MAFINYSTAVNKPKWLKSAKTAAVHSPGQKYKRVRAEAQGNATWARFALNAPNGTLQLQVDIALAITAKLALS